VSFCQDGIKNGFQQHNPFSTQDEENSKNIASKNGIQIEKEITLNSVTF
jgi:hypothetical protein